MIGALGIVVTKQMVDDALKQSVTRLSFAPSLEAYYEQETGKARCRHLQRFTLVGLVVFNAFVFADLSLVPDVAALGFFLRFGVATLGLVALAIHLRFDPHPVWREFAHAMMTTIAVGVVLYLMLASHAPLRIYQHYGVGLCLLYPTIVQRIQFRYMAGTVVACFTIYSVAVGMVHEIPSPAQASAIMVMLGIGIFTLIAGYSLERQERMFYVLSLRDRLRNAELDADAKTDPLTRLGNRRSLDATMAKLWAVSEATATPVCFLMLDIDRFKAFNDLYGHPMGDRCIAAVARCVEQNLRGDLDRAFRFGGEEFLIVLNGSDLEHGLAIAERVRTSVEGLGMVHAGGIAGIVTVSLGVASAIPGALVSPGELIGKADVALYAAKADGRNRVSPPPRSPFVVEGAMYHHRRATAA